MNNEELRQRIQGANSLEEVKRLADNHPGINAETVWKEIEKHRSNNSEKLDLEELESVSGGADRDWTKDGCASTCEWTDWCWSNDLCELVYVTYDNFWATCPNHEEHLFYDKKCVKCGYYQGHYPV